MSAGTKTARGRWLAIDDPETGVNAADAAYETLDLADLEARPVRVAFTVLPTLVAVADAACGRVSSVPDAWVRSARLTLRGRDVQVLRPLILRPDGFVPACLLSLPDATAITNPAAALAGIAQRAPDALRAELTAAGGDSIARTWAEASADPKKWVLRYVRALARIWRAIEVDVRGASALIDREIDRVGSALARGALPALVAELHPRAEMDGKAWRLPARRPQALTLSERGLVLVPKLSGTRSSVIKAYEGNALTHLAYPVPGGSRALGEGPPPPSSLVALLGGQRSTILRRLDRPQTVGGLATALNAVPGTASHHANALEAAGLVARERAGRQVLVHRTARGTALLALYD